MSKYSKVNGIFVQFKSLYESFAHLDYSGRKTLMINLIVLTQFYIMFWSKIFRSTDSLRIAQGGQILK